MTALVVDPRRRARRCSPSLSLVRERGRRSPKLTTASPTRVVFPFTGAALSQRGARRGAPSRARRRRDARAGVPRRRCRCTCRSMPRFRAPATARCRCWRRSSSAPCAAGVAVDSRIERGRSYRHAIRELVEHEHFDTIVVTAGDAGDARAFCPTTSAGCSSTCPARSSSSGPEPSICRTFLCRDGSRARNRARRVRGRASARRPARPAASVSFQASGAATLQMHRRGRRRSPRARARAA